MIMNIMFSMILKFEYSLVLDKEFLNFEKHNKLCLMFGMILKFEYSSAIGAEF